MSLSFLFALVVALRAETTVPPAAVDVQWSAPAGCPDADDVEAELRRLTNDAVVVESGAPVSVTAIVTESELGFRLELRIERHGAVETQTLNAKTCATLARAVALVAGVDLVAEPEPLQVAPPPPTPVPPPAPHHPSSPPVATQPPPARSESPPPESPASTTSPRRTWQVLASVGAGPSLGFVPRITAALGGSLGVQRGPWQVAVHGFHHFVARDEVVPPAQLAGSLTGGGVRGCWVPRIAPLEFPLCAGAGLGSLRTEPSADVQPRRVNRDLWVGASLDASLVWVLVPRLALFVRAMGAASLRRPAVHWNVEGTQRLVFRVAPVVGSLVLGPQLRLP